MRKMATTSEHTPLRRLAEQYWVESRRPLAGLVFIAPLLVLYEVGVVWLGAQNGADLFMRRSLDWLGFGQHLLLPALTACILLAWHYLSRQPWRLSGGILSAMAAESLLLGLCLWLCYLLFSVTPAANIAGRMKEGLRSVVGPLGAGIYEELLFRLILLSALWWLLRYFWTTSWKSLAAAVLASSLLFALAHYIGPGGEEVKGFSFVFRFLAGVFFGVIFVYRGFGIAAGSHALYDILVGLFTG
jgi:membrane protease YdiL (CAAX protease family)